MVLCLLDEDLASRSGWELVLIVLAPISVATVGAAVVFLSGRGRMQARQAAALRDMGFVMEATTTSEARARAFGSFGMRSGMKRRSSGVLFAADGTYGGRPICVVLHRSCTELGGSWKHPRSRAADVVHWVVQTPCPEQRPTSVIVDAENTTWSIVNPDPAVTLVAIEWRHGLQRQWMQGSAEPAFLHQLLSPEMQLWFGHALPHEHFLIDGGRISYSRCFDWRSMEACTALHPMFERLLQFVDLVTQESAASAPLAEHESEPTEAV
jgi:hypothetical protein